MIVIRVRQNKPFAGEGARATRAGSADFPFWAGFPHLCGNLLASGFPQKSNREIRRHSRLLDRRLILFGE
jgi:hypothetical protein